MARFLKIAAIGGNPANPGAWMPEEQAVRFVCEHLREKFSQVLCDQPELIVLAETCDIPSTYTVEEKLSYVRNRKEQVLHFVRDTAIRHRTYIAYPTIRFCPDGTYRNSTYFINPQGEVLGIYDKSRLTIGEMEEMRMLCGAGPLVVDCPIGRIGFVTCFDLNFASLQQDYARQKPELLLFSSAFHGGPLQTHWALANRAYFVSAVERLPCSVLAPTGELLSSSTNYFEHLVCTVNLDYALLHLDFNMEKLKRAKAKYGGKIRIQDPGLLGAVLLTAESEEFTAAGILEEFGLEELEEYLCRAETLQARHMAE